MMVVYVLEKAPQRLRGAISRYCLEVRAGLFVGRLDTRMRDLLWEKVLTLAKATTRGVMIWREPTAQGYAFRTIGEGERRVVILDGVWLVTTESESRSSGQPGEGSEPPLVTNDEGMER